MKKPNRFLRYYHRIAQRQYVCNRCDIPIFPGDPYHGEVWIIDGKIRIMRSHDGCPCLPPDEEEKEKKEVEAEEEAKEPALAA